MTRKENAHVQVGGKSSCKAFRASDYLRIRKAAQAIIFEGTVIACAGSALADGRLTETDRRRALVSVPRIYDAIKTIVGCHGC